MCYHACAYRKCSKCSYCSLMKFVHRRPVKAAAIPALLLSGRPLAPRAGRLAGAGTAAESAPLSGGRPSCPELRPRHRDRTPAHHCVSPLLAAVRPPATRPQHRFPATANHGPPASSYQFTALSPDVVRRATRTRPRPPGNGPSGHRRPGSPGWRDGGGRDVPSFERTSRGRIGPATARGLSREGQ